MAITVKKLIAELEKIDNKFLEVEVMADYTKDPLELEEVRKIPRKVILTIRKPKLY